MATLEEIRTMAKSLAPAERSALGASLLRENGRDSVGISKTPGVVGGQACIGRTRIPVWIVEGYRRSGWTDERILEGYPALTPADLANAWAYVMAHPDEIEQDIHDHDNDPD